MYLFICLSVRLVIWCDYVFRSYCALKVLTSPQYRASVRCFIVRFPNAATDLIAFDDPTATGFHIDGRGRRSSLHSNFVMSILLDIINRRIYRRSSNKPAR